MKSKSAVKKTAKVCACAAKPKAKRAAKVRKSAVSAVAFTLREQAGKAVFLAGSFNKWDPAALPMKDAKGTGVYAAAVKLAPGRYEYKFVVDGLWRADPECADFVQNDHGTLNSVINVK